jgi:hypothetical protein
MGCWAVRDSTGKANVGAVEINIYLRRLHSPTLLNKRKKEERKRQVDLIFTYGTVGFWHRQASATRRFGDCRKSCACSSLKIHHGLRYGDREITIKFSSIS